MVKHGSKMRDPLPPFAQDDPVGKERARLHQMRYTLDTLLASPNCPPGFKAHHQWYPLMQGGDLEERKVDVTRCRRNTLYYSTHEWPVYCAMDEIEPFDGHVRCGLF